MSSYSGDAAEQVVRMSLEGAELAVRLAGSGAKQLAILLYAILKDQHKTRGKIRLTNMLRSGRELKVFAVQDKDLRLFCTEAKKYGVLYTILKDRDANDGLTDIMVRAEDASKINRIFERYKLTTVEMGSVKSQTERKEPKRTKQKESKQEKIIADATVQPEKTLPELEVPEWMIAKKEDKTITQEPEQERALTKQEKVDEFLNEIFNVDAIKEEQNQNPTTGRTAESRQSEPSLKKSPTIERDVFGDPNGRPSVKTELDEIRKGQNKEKTSPGITDRTQENIFEMLQKIQNTHKEEQTL